MYVNRDSQLNFTTTLIEEVQKQGREYLYDLSHKSYRNTCLKQNTWQEIGKAVGVSAADAQKKWRALRSKYMQLAKQAKSGSAAGIKTKDEWIIRALDFLKVHIINEPTISSSLLDQDQFDSRAEEIYCTFQNPVIIEETENAVERPQHNVETTLLAEASTSPVAGSSAFKYKRAEHVKRQKVSHAVPLDPNITYICDTIKAQNKILKEMEPKEKSKEVPCKCLMQVFANTWSEDVAKWPRSEQADHFALLTRLTEQKNDELNIPQDEPFEFTGINNEMI